MLQGLDAAGEFYHDVLNDEILYIDDPTNNPCGSPCVGIVPAIDTLISVVGWTKPATPVADIALVDLILQHAGDGGEARFSAYAGGPVAVVQLGPEVSALTIVRCDLEHGGGSGLLIANPSVRGVVVQSSRLTDLGGEGISLQSQDTRDVLVADCEVSETGHIFMEQPAIIRLKGQSNISVINNNVHHGPYGGIMIGWEHPGEPTPSPAVFHVRRNHVHDYGMGVLSDFVSAVQ